MAKPQIYKTGNSYGTPASPLIFERGRIWPHPDKLEINQTTEESGAGYLYTVTNGSAHNFYTLSFKKISNTQIENIINFLADSTVNYKAKTFTFKDESAVTHTVNYVSDTFDRNYVPPSDEQSFSILVREV